MKKSVFTPLNISYPIQRYSNFLFIGVLAAVIVAAIGIIIVLKVSIDMMFSPIFGSPLFKIIGIFLSLYAGLFVFRKIGLRERELMRLYDEMIDHEITTINDLWDIIAVDGNVATYMDNSCKIFLKCEKGYVISRPAEHMEQHYKCIEAFLKFLLDKGYYIDYYNWHDRDANTAPLMDLEDKLNSNPNRFLRDYGNSVIKYCRNLEYQCTDSEVEYFIISSRDANMSAFLESSVEAATEYLQGSLYEDIRICDIDDIVEYIELINKIQGINVSEMLSNNALKTTQRVVQVIKIFGAERNIDTTEDANVLKEDEEYQQFLNVYDQVGQSKRSKSKKNLAKKDIQSDLKPIPIDTDNVITESDIPILMEEYTEPELSAEDDTVDINPSTAYIEDDDIEFITTDSDDELLDDDILDNSSEDELLDDDDDELLDDNTNTENDNPNSGYLSKFGDLDSLF